MTIASPRSVETDPATAPLATALKAGWGFGSVGTQVLLFSQSLLLLFFFTTVLGLQPGVAGALLFAGKLFDAFIAPLVGNASDRAASRFGRRRPFLLAGAVLCAAGLLLVFHPPIVSIPGLFAALILISIGYSCFNIPYLAMSAEMTDSPAERTSLMSWRIAFVGVGTLIATSLLPLISRTGGGGAVGYSRVGIVAAAIVFLAMTVAFFATRPARGTVTRGETASPLAMFAAVASNRPFTWLLVAKLLQLVGLAASAASMLFFFKNVIGGGESMLAVWGAVSNLVSIASMAFWPAIGRRFGKVPVYAVSVIGFALVGFTWLLAGPGTELAGVIVRSAASGVFIGGLLLMGQSLIPDVIATDFARTGLRREGLLSGAYSFVEKASSALGPMVVGGLFQLMGFGVAGSAARNDPQAVYLAAAVVPSMAYLLSAWPIWRIGVSLRAEAATAAELRRIADAASRPSAGPTT